MNFVYLSPHFPPHYLHFAQRLNELGARVLGLADEPYENLRPELLAALTEYYRVRDMHHYDSLLRALGYFTHQHGKIDRVESFNEFWLETEARLRTDFNVDGFKMADTPRIKRKSLMKQVFAVAGVPVAPGLLVKGAEEARAFAAEVGYPLVAKPDVGVGANETFKLHTPEELEGFLARQLAGYLLEPFIEGTIQSFDGLTDRNGRILFYTSHQYGDGVMEIITQQLDTFYYSLRDIPADLVEMGQQAVHAFAPKERFFHMEFFRREDGSLVALEANLRPPGGFTTDMFNFANDMDVYRQYAQVVVHNHFTAQVERPYHCAYVARRHGKTYTHSHEAILAAFGARVVAHQPVIGIISVGMGNYGYLVRSPHEAEIWEMARFIRQTQ